MGESSGARSEEGFVTASCELPAVQLAGELRAVLQMVPLARTGLALLQVSTPQLLLLRRSSLQSLLQAPQSGLEHLVSHSEQSEAVSRVACWRTNCAAATGSAMSCLCLCSTGCDRLQLLTCRALPRRHALLSCTGCRAPPRLTSGPPFWEACTSCCRSTCRRLLSLRRVPCSSRSASAGPWPR